MTSRRVSKDEFFAEPRKEQAKRLAGTVELEQLGLRARELQAAHESKAADAKKSAEEYERRLAEDRRHANKPLDDAADQWRRSVESESLIISENAKFRPMSGGIHDWEFDFELGDWKEVPSGEHELKISVDENGRPVWMEFKRRFDMALRHPHKQEGIEKERPI
jgi:hypothetical protein